jgi:hypothetical protein
VDQAEPQDQALPGQNPKAIRLQIITALIAYLLLKQLHQAKAITIPLKRVAAIATNYLFNLGDINQLIKPPDRHPPPKPTNQLLLDFPVQ